MTMTSFLRSMIWRGGDNDRQNVTIAETQCIAEQENKRITNVMSDWLENRSQSASNIPEITGRPRRPSTLRLFGNSKKFLSNMTSGESYNDFQGSKTSTSRLVEDVVREFEESYKSPTRTPSKKSKNFVKKLVAALERKHRDNDVDDVVSATYNSGPIHAYEKTGTIRKSGVNYCDENQVPGDNSNEANHVIDKTTVKAKGEIPSSKTTKPKIIGAFLKKPVQVEDTSIYWIPITGKKLPRKKSFKKLLAKLTGKNGGKSSETKTKQVVFASQANLIEEIHDSGYEGRSTCSSTSSLTSFAETLMYHDNNYVDNAYRDCNFSTFVTSSPLKKNDPGHRNVVNSSKDLSKLFTEKNVTSRAVEFREDSGYISNHSILEENSPKKNLVATRVQQISYQLAKLPKHPFARSEPRLYQQNNEEQFSCGEIITLRRCKDQPIYDVPQTRPRSSIFDESLSMKRRNLPIQTVPPFSYSGYSVFANRYDNEEPHYATVKPRNGRNRVSYDNLCPNLSLTLEEDPTVLKKSLHSSCADLTANESFVISMYV